MPLYLGIVLILESIKIGSKKTYKKHCKQQQYPTALLKVVLTVAFAVLISDNINYPNLSTFEIVYPRLKTNLIRPASISAINSSNAS